MLISNLQATHRPGGTQRGGPRPWRLGKLLSVVAITALSACAEPAPLPPDAGVGPSPTLPPPVHSTVPTVLIAPAVRWPAGTQPTPMNGLRVIPTEAAFRQGQIAGYLTRTHTQYLDMNHWPALLDTLRSQPA